MFEPLSDTTGDEETVTYQQLDSFDCINVELVPEKKGLILKHSEYAVTSRRHGTTVYRRYSDFVVLHDILLAKYPYRAVCRLPPKRVTVGGGSAVFLERRRAALRRWLTLTATHPTLAHDADTRAFLCEAAPPAHHSCKDEFLLASPHLAPADCVSEEMLAEFHSEREHLALLYFAFNRLNQLFTHEEQRCESERGCVQELRGVLASLSRPASTPAPADSAPAWTRVRRALGKAALAAQCPEPSSEGAACEQFRLAQDALAAHRDLCCRLSRGAPHPDTPIKWGSQSDGAAAARARHFYALRCAAGEARVARAHALAALEALPDVLEAHALARARAAALWAELRKAFTGANT